MVSAGPSEAQARCWDTPCSDKEGTNSQGAMPYTLSEINRRPLLSPFPHLHTALISAPRKHLSRRASTFFLSDNNKELINFKKRSFLLFFYSSSASFIFVVSFFVFQPHISRAVFRRGTLPKGGLRPVATSDRVGSLIRVGLSPAHRPAS